MPRATVLGNIEVPSRAVAGALASEIFTGIESLAGATRDPDLQPSALVFTLCGSVVLGGTHREDRDIGCLCASEEWDAKVVGQF
jgi:hypothetical protein